MKMLRRSRIGGAAFCLNCRGKKSNWGKLRGKTHCGEVQSQLFLAELEIIERKKTGNSTFPAFFFGSGRRIRTLTYGVRVRCATFTQSRYIANARVIIPNFRRMSSGIGKFSLNFFYFFARQSMETLSPVRRKNKTPSRTGFPSSRVSAAA